ncbi:MAG: polyprenyl synthetase family protein [Paludibacteraceae bacterium]|nr:polyprenyl synthetase family protein [Paludibacteraceae bacterium]
MVHGMIDINKSIEALDWNKEPRGLYEPIEYTLASGGKRLRPTLALIAAKVIVNGGLLNGDVEEHVLPAALALEVFHNFTLLHDDVMDRAEVRRGRPTVHVKWNDNTAILSGDQMLIEAYKLLSNVPADKLPQVLKMFNDMATGICEGQQYDIDFEHMSHVSIDEYMKMIELKTSVLLAYAMKIGGYIAGANDAQLEALYQFGLHIGLAFQIQDDILDVYGDPKTFGKAIGGDICCNKKTFLLLTAMETADAESKAELLQWLLETERNEEKIAAVTKIYDRLGVRDAGEAEMERHTSIALEQLDKLPQNEATETLRELAEKLTTRKS